MTTISIDAIRAQEEADRKAYEARTVVTQEGETIAQLREVFDAVANPANWKDAFAVYVHHSLVGRVIRATQFFHGDTPVVVGIQALTGRVLVEGRGYQCD